MTIARLRQEANKEDPTLKRLMQAWQNASVAAQEQFVRTNRIDLAGMLNDPA